MNSCLDCSFEPDWVVDFDLENMWGECKKDNEPILRVDGKLYINGTCESLVLLERCKNHRRTKNG